MYPRTNYEMTEAQEKSLLDAMQPVPMIMLQCGPGRSQQERANDAWEYLGREMGFDHMTVQPREGYGQRHFTAVPSETPEQRKEREERQALEQRRAEIARLTAERDAIQAKLTTMLD